MKKVSIILLSTLLLTLFIYANVCSAERSHAQFAALTYSLTDVTGAGFVGNHYDIAINPTGANYTAVRNGSYGTKCLRYITISSLRGDDMAQLQMFCNERGYDINDLILKTSDYVCLSSIAPAGPPCSGAITCTDPGGYLNACGWNSYRNYTDLTKPEIWEYLWWKTKATMGDGYDGVMDDECPFWYHPLWDYYEPMSVFPFKPSKWTTGGAPDIVGWEGHTHDQIRDSLMFLKQNVWLPDYMDSMRANGKLRFPNPAAYGVLGSDVIEDCKLTGSGVLLGEGMHLRPLGGYWNDVAWDVMGYIADSTDAGYAIVWLEIMAADSNSLGSWDRCLWERYGYYLMKHDPERMWCMITGNEVWLRHNDYQAKDSLYKWLPAFDYDIGKPVGKCYGRDQYTHVREMENSVVYYRPVGGGPSVLTYNLGETCFPLMSDGTLGDPVTSVDLYNGDAKIMVKDYEPGPVESVEITMEPRHMGVTFIGGLKNNGSDTVFVNVDVYKQINDGPMELIFNVPGVELAPGVGTKQWYHEGTPIELGDSIRIVAEAKLAPTGELMDTAELKTEIK